MSVADEIWGQVLDRLESDVTRVERALDAGETPDAAPWCPPVDTGPVPDHLRPRAERVLARQQRALAAVSRAADTAARHQQLNGRLRNEAATRPAAVYVDVRA